MGGLQTVETDYINRNSIHMLQSMVTETFTTYLIIVLFVSGGKKIHLFIYLFIGI